MNISIKKTVLSLGLIISVLAISERARVDASPPGLILNDAQINAVFSNPLAYRYQAARVAENILSPALPAADRTYIENHLPLSRTTYQLLSRLDSSHLNIAILDSRTGHIYYNKPELQGSYATRFVVGAMDPNPSIIKRLTPYDYHGGLNPGTGPYRRVYSTNKPYSSSVNYAFEAAQVSITCNNGPIALHDQGYEYMGGWGAGNGYAIDAGLAYDLNQPQGSTDAYTPFIKINGGGIQSQGYTFLYSSPSQHNPGGNFHIPCSSGPAALGYTVQAAFDAFGNKIGYQQVVSAAVPFAGTYEGYVVVVAGFADNDGGFSPACTGCVLKRMTSIAQGSQNLNSGSTFKAAWSNAQIECGFDPTCGLGDYNLTNWTSTVTQGCQEYPAWTTAMNGTQDCMSYNSTNVSVNYMGTNAELDLISTPTAYRTPCVAQPVGPYQSTQPLLAPSPLSTCLPRAPGQVAPSS